jgi:hypothetical protein
MSDEPTKSAAVVLLEVNVAELQKRLAALEKYIAACRAHGQLPNLRAEQ